MSKDIINIISNRNYQSIRVSKLLRHKLIEAGYWVADSYDKSAILNICIGGDGAFLRAVHKNNFPSIPFVGINTGHLGFFQEILPKDIDSFIEKFKSGDYELEEVSLVDATIFTKGKNFKITAVNEITIKAIKSKVIHLDIYIDGNHLEKFSGDGVIVSTPVGSTAYNFSSGGSIVYPTLNTLQLTPLSPINSQAFRSLPNSAIIPGDTIITIKPEARYKDSSLLINDGVELRYNNINKIELTISNTKIKRLIFNRNTYWSNLKSKFL